MTNFKKLQKARSKNTSKSATRSISFSLKNFMKIKLQSIFLLSLSSLFILTGLAGAEERKVDFMVDIKPILEFNCVSCHQESKVKGKLRLDTEEWMRKGGDNGQVVANGKPDESSLYTTTTLDRDDDDVMPPVKSDKDYTLSKQQQDLLALWIKQGAPWTKGVKLKGYKKQPRKIDFVKHVQPILEHHCVSCHNDKKDKGDLRIDTKALAFKGGENGECIIPGKPNESSFYYLTTLDKDDDDIMPPAKKEPLTDKEIYTIRRWIEEGAEWPDNIKLLPRKKVKKDKGIDPKKLYADLKFVNLNFEHIEAKPKKYTQKIPQTDYSFEMMPIQGGTFKMGSPGKEPGRTTTEGPQQDITIKPFWMAKNETVWQHYELWLLSIEKDTRILKKMKAKPNDLLADAVSRATAPYTDMTFGMGKEDYPAICMTQLAAKTYCMWLSAKTGIFYRLPTEAEWEYACRAGTTTAYHFGDDASQLGEYAWHEDNSDFQYQKVGLKKPNPWGLHDMHGNVWEWVLDQYTPDFYAKNKVKTNPLRVPTQLYPRTVRGGSWDDTPDKLRSASRRGSNPNWKQKDPQIPKSVWYHTDAHWVGFRVVRPLEIPPLEDLHKYWPTKAEIDAIPMDKQ